MVGTLLLLALLGQSALQPPAALNDLSQAIFPPVSPRWGGLAAVRTACSAP